MTTTLIDFFSPTNFAQFASAEKKRFRLTVFMCFLSLTVGILYAVIDLINGVFYALPIYAILFATPFATLWLLKSGHIITGKMLLLLAALLATFFASVSDPFEAGVFMIYVPFSITSFALVGFEKRWINLSFSFLVVAVFYFAYFGDFRLPYEQNPPAHYLAISLIFNFIIAVGSSILMVYFLIELNAESEAELKEKEKDLLEKNSALEKLNQELDRFVYSVSHDLRSPLSSILGLTNLAKFENNTDELKKYMGMIQERVKAQDEFIKEIIEYSRNVRVELKSEEIPFHAFILEQIEALRFLEGASNIHFEIEINEKLTLQTDKARWKTILSNLIGNAIKYHDQRKEKRYIKISALLTGNVFTITIQDNGSGISDEHKDKIFDMFYRGTDASTGSGLGLYITSEAVKQLNGRIEVNSEQGKGSNFIVKVPVFNSAKT
ncbi:MAG: HAMP domain-containing histidine kinase [Cyclobacteriaceae bacterium]|nr:HAMP domain-containing histidine kinase [Cyclobacteriaceae bacterium]